MTYIVGQFDLTGELLYYSSNAKARERNTIQFATIDLLDAGPQADVRKLADEITSQLPHFVAAAGGITDDGKQWILVAQRALEERTGEMQASLRKAMDACSEELTILASESLTPDQIEMQYDAALTGPFPPKFEFTAQVNALVAKLLGFTLERIVAEFDPRCAFRGENHECVGSYFVDLARAFSDGRLPAPRSLSPDPGDHKPEPELDESDVFKSPELAQMGLGAAERNTVEMILRIQMSGDDSRILQAAEGYEQRRERRLSRPPLCPMCSQRTKWLRYGKADGKVSRDVIIAACAPPKTGPTPALGCSCGWRGIDWRNPAMEDVPCPQCGVPLPDALGHYTEEGSCECGWSGEYIAHSVGQLMTLMDAQTANQAFGAIGDCAGLDDDLSFPIEDDYFAGCIVVNLGHDQSITFPKRVSDLQQELLDFESEIYDWEQQAVP